MWQEWYMIPHPTPVGPAPQRILIFFIHIRLLVLVIAWKVFGSVTGVICILCCNVSVL